MRSRTRVRSPGHRHSRNRLQFLIDRGTVRSGYAMPGRPFTLINRDSFPGVNLDIEGIEDAS